MARIVSSKETPFGNGGASLKRGSIRRCSAMIPKQRVAKIAAPKPNSAVRMPETLSLRKDILCPSDFLSWKPKTARRDQPVVAGGGGGVLPRYVLHSLHRQAHAKISASSETASITV